MEAIQYLLVSIFLFCDKTKSGNITNLHLKSSVTSASFGLTSTENTDISKCFPNLRIPTILRDLTDSDYEFNNKCFMDKVVEPVELETSKKEITSKNITEVSHDVSLMIDDIVNGNNDVQNLYKNVVYFFVDKWEQLATYNNILNDYPRYLGFDPKTMDLIDRAMTILLFLQRKSHIIVNELASAYLYSCDLENNFKLDDRITEEKNKDIQNKFNEYLVKYGSYRIQFTIQDLENSIKATTIKVKTSFNITVPLIKNWAILKKTEDKTFVTLKNIIVIIHNETLKLSELVTYMLGENDYPVLIETHVLILQQEIIQLYGFAVNHFELTVNLCKYVLNENDMKTIDGFRTFMYFFVPLFVDRFFEMDGLLHKPFINGLLNVMNFMFPESGGDFKDRLSIRNYNEKNQNKNVLLKDHIFTLSEDALDAMLKYFNIEGKEFWKGERNYYMKFRGIISDEEVNPPNKEEILSLMDENFKAAMNALVLFLPDYDVGLPLCTKVSESSDSSEIRIFST